MLDSLRVINYGTLKGGVWCEFRLIMKYAIIVEYRNNLRCYNQSDSRVGSLRYNAQ